MEFAAQGLRELDVADHGVGLSYGVDQHLVAVDEWDAETLEHGNTENCMVEDEAGSKDDAADSCNDEEVGKTNTGNKEDKDDSDIKSEYWGSDEQPPLDLNYDALKHVAKYFLPGAHGACIDITTLMRGSWHEIRVLHFEDGWTCIGRFTREAEPLHKTESELATMEHVRKHSKIRVPEIFFVNHNENHAVGAPFVLMERLKGGPLDLLWLGLSLEHKLGVVEQLAHFYGELGTMKFDRIGSLKAGGSVGPLIGQVQWWQPLGDDSFSTTAEYLCSYMREDNPERAEGARALYPAIKSEILSYLAQNASDPALHAPYRLIQGDFGLQNVMVDQQDNTQPPKITGIIDWEWSFVGPMYYLCEYPNELLIDDSDTPKFRREAKILRKRFASALAHHFPKGSADRELVRKCFREKNYLMSYFEVYFIKTNWEVNVEPHSIGSYLREIQEQDPARKSGPYDVSDWQPDSESESDGEAA